MSIWCRRKRRSRRERDEDDEPLLPEWKEPLEMLRVKHDYSLFAASRLNRSEQEVFACCVRGYSVAEMSDMLEVTHHRIARIKVQIGRKLVSFLGLEVAPPQVAGMLGS